MDLIYYYWLTTVSGLGVKKIKNIIDYFGSIENAWEGNYGEFVNVKGIFPGLAEKIISRRDKSKLMEEVGNIQKKGIDIITISDERYPQNLKNIYDPPLIIYLKGRYKTCKKYIGIVGSRTCTNYGRTVARNLSESLSKYDIGIISGMARGIDTESHLGALKGGGFTCAVLGCGCDIVYPPENKRLMTEIAERGAIISEYPLGTKPNAGNFPARNRIISGLCDGVLVVEAGEKSGALITANFALENNRDVFAVPGSILSDLSKGTNNLIKEGAKLVNDISDILCELGIEFKAKNVNDIGVELNPKEKLMMDIIKDSPIHFDDLICKIRLKANEVNSLLTSLELKGLIKTLPGKFIVGTFFNN